MVFCTKTNDTFSPRAWQHSSNALTSDLVLFFFMLPSGVSTGAVSLAFKCADDTLAVLLKACHVGAPHGCPRARESVHKIWRRDLKFFQIFERRAPLISMILHQFAFVFALLAATFSLDSQTCGFSKLLTTRASHWHLTCMTSFSFCHMSKLSFALELLSNILLLAIILALLQGFPNFCGGKYHFSGVATTFLRPKKNTRSCSHVFNFSAFCVIQTWWTLTKWSFWTFAAWEEADFLTVHTLPSTKLNGTRLRYKRSLV